MSDHLIARKIAEVVAKLIKTNLPTKTRNQILEIFNVGLERGWSEFYGIYYDLIQI